MGRTSKIDKHKLIGMLADNFNDAEIGRKLGVSRQAINKKRRQLQLKAESGSKDKMTQQFIGARLNVQEQMADVNEKTLWLFNQVLKALKGEPHELKPFTKEKSMRWIEKDQNGKRTTKSQKEIEKMQFKTDPVQLAFLGAETSRGTWKLWLEILQYINPINEFQTLFKLLFNHMEKNYEPDIRDRIFGEFEEIVGHRPILVSLRRTPEAGEAGGGANLGNEQLQSIEVPPTKEGD